MDETSVAVRREYGEVGHLDSADRARIATAFATAATGHRSGGRPGPAAAGVRWSDLDDAIVQACGEVQMAMVRGTDVEGGRRYAIITVDDRPVQLDVVRLDGPPHFELRASVGRFGDPDLEAALEQAVAWTWRSFGRKRGVSRSEPDAP